MLVNTQTDLPQFFRRHFFLYGFKHAKIQPKERVPLELCSVGALPASLDSGKLREAVWSLREATVQSTIT